MGTKTFESKYVTHKGLSELALLGADWELVTLLRMLSRVQSSYTPDFETLEMDDDWIDPCPVAQIYQACMHELGRRRVSFNLEEAFHQLGIEEPVGVSSAL